MTFALEDKVQLASLDHHGAASSWLEVRSLGEFSERQGLAISTAFCIRVVLQICSWKSC